MGRPPNPKLCNCPKDITTCCCSRKLSRSFTAELLDTPGECDCWAQYFDLKDEINLPSRVLFCMIYDENTKTWRAKMDFRDVCCETVWCFWFFCPERTDQPCEESEGLCPPEFSCQDFKARIYCRDALIESDLDCYKDFESAFEASPTCCSCSCNSCFSIGWVFDFVLGDVCKCGSTKGVRLIIKCPDENSTQPFECPSTEVDNCCCICTPTPLEVCITDDLGCTCYTGPGDGSECAILSYNANFKCCEENNFICEACWTGSLTIPGCDVIHLALCCSFDVSTLTLIHDLCTGGDPCTADYFEAGIGPSCEPILMDNECTGIGGSCGCEGEQGDLCLTITE